MQNANTKDILKNSYRYDNNPYHIALKFCVEHLFNFLIASNQQKKITHIVVEQRGKTEDRDLELEFSRICSKGNFKGMFKEITNWAKIGFC
jgi:hypothetical protein